MSKETIIFLIIAVAGLLSLYPLSGLLEKQTQSIFDHGFEKGLEACEFYNEEISQYKINEQNGKVKSLQSELLDCRGLIDKIDMWCKIPNQ